MFQKIAPRFPRAPKGISLAETLLASFLFLLILGIVVNSLSVTARMTSLQLDDNQLKRDCLQITDQLVADFRGCDLPVLSYRSGTLNQRIHLPAKTCDQETQEAVMDSEAVAGVIINDHRGNQIEYNLDSEGTLRRLLIPFSGTSAGAVEVATNVTSLSFEPYNAALGLKDRHWKIGVSVGRSQRNFPDQGQFKIDVAVRTDIADAVAPRLDPGGEPPGPVTTTIGGGGGGGNPTTSIPATTTVRNTTTTVRGNNTGTTTTIRRSITRNPIPRPPAFRPRIIVLTRRQITVPGPPRITVGGVGRVSLPSIASVMYGLPGSRTHSWHGGTYDCWGLSDLMFRAFTQAGYGARILTFATSYSSNHRQVQVFYGGGWHDVDPRNYGYDWLFATRSAPGGARVISLSNGADFTRANQLTDSMNNRLRSFYQLVNSQLMNNARNSQNNFTALRTITGWLNGGDVSYNNGMGQLNHNINDINNQYTRIRAQVALANEYLRDQRRELNEANRIGSGNPVAANWAAGIRNAYNHLAGQVSTLNSWFNGFRSQVSTVDRWYSNAYAANNRMLLNYNRAVAESQRLEQTINRMSDIEDNSINPAGAQITQNNENISRLVGQLNSGSLTRDDGIPRIESLVTDNQNHSNQAGRQISTMNTYGRTLQNQYNLLRSYTAGLNGFNSWNRQASAATRSALSSLSNANNWLRDVQQSINSQQQWLNGISNP